MKKYLKFIIIFVAIISFIILILNSKKTYSIETTIEEQRNAILATANAYYNKGEYIQYDSFRVQHYFSPEQATKQHTVFTVCNQFVFQVYNQALGMEIPDTTETTMEYAKKYKDNKELILYYFDNAEDIYSDDWLGNSVSNVENLVNNLEKELEIGDVINIRRDNNTGHAMIYIGKENGELYLLESGGTRYNTSSHIDIIEKNGSIIKTLLKDKLQEMYEAKGKTSQINNFEIIRYIIDGKTYINSNYEKISYNGITEAAKTRLEYPGIDIDKTYKINNPLSTSSKSQVNLGGTITYTIKIKNNSSNNYNNIDIIENISPKVNLLSSENKIINDSTVKWNNVTIKANEEKEFSYTVKVPYDKSLLGEYVESTGKVLEIDTTNIAIKINNSLTTEQKNKIVESYNNFKDNPNTTNWNNETDFINTIYKNALGEVGESLINKTVYNKVIGDYVQPTFGNCSSTNCAINLTSNTNLKNAILNNYYGIRLVNSTNEAKDSNNLLVYAWRLWNFDVKNNRSEYNETAREIKLNDLEIGDIILSKSETNSIMYDKVYLYLGNNLLARYVANNNNYTLIEYSDGKNGRSTIDTMLNIFIGNNYVILRPALLLEPIEIEEEKSNINTLKSLQLSGCSIDFNSSTTSYYVTVKDTITSIDITSELTDDKSSYVSGFGNRKVELSPGVNTILIKVIAENGDIKTYSIYVTRDNKSSINTLKFLQLSGCSIDFNSSTTSYYVTVKDTITNIDITSELTDDKSSYVSGFGNRKVELSPGVNTIFVKVMAENGDIKTYSIYVTRELTENELLKTTDILKLNIKNYNIEFSNDILEYFIEIENEDKLDISLTLLNEKANYEILNNENLQDGSIIIIKITAENGIDTKEYKLYINRNNNSDNNEDEKTNEFNNEQNSSKESNSKTIINYLIITSITLVTIILIIVSIIYFYNKKHQKY